MRCSSLILSISVKAEALTDKAERCGGGRDCAVSSKEQTCFSSSNKQQLPLLVSIREGIERHSSEFKV